ncbi:MAG: ABC-F family ATP-binding cassette domain-containing protein, partial [Bacteroidia bacterium]|nr:ABC-F family ATP-binding cassette domain-containing protein [Bacteroidia bacterium]
MNYLSVENLSKSYGPKVLFDNIVFGISQFQKVALVAQNGVGKTTLLNILAGLDIPDSGEVVVRKQVTLSFLQQEPEFADGSSVIDVLFDDNNPVALAVKQYEKAIIREDYDAIPDLSQAIDDLNGWNYESDAMVILSKLNLTDYNQQVSTLSGGQKKRLALARVLIQKPDLLIMDEPTNHLDINMVEWLEEWLKNSNLTLLLVTHDRYFLDRVCDEILELDKGNIFKYKGNYSYYIEKKAEREMAQSSEIDKAKNLYRRELEWVRRMPKARGTKSKSRLDAFDEVKDKALTRTNTDKLQLSVKMTRLGGKILELINLKKSYGDKTILKPFSYVFKKGEKVGV